MKTVSDLPERLAPAGQAAGGHIPGPVRDAINYMNREAQITEEKRKMGLSQDPYSRVGLGLAGSDTGKYLQQQIVDPITEKARASVAAEEEAKRIQDQKEREAWRAAHPNKYGTDVELE